MSIKRDLKFYKQIKLSIVFKFLSVVISFLLIKYMIIYLGIVKYGVWAVLFSIINFILNFDLGIVNGVRNKVAVSLSKFKVKEAKKFITVGYIVAIIFVIVVYILILIFAKYINWQIIFNITIISNKQLHMLVLVVTFFILCNFVISIVISLYHATQNSSFIIINQFLTQLIALVLILLLIKFTSSNILYLAIAYGLSLVSSNVLLSFLFYKKYVYLLPSVKYFDKSKIKSVLSIGFKFFLLQLTILFILSTDRILITQLLGPEYVTTYEILYKYFSLVLLIHSIINTPLWSMYTEAYEKKDYIWISNTLKKMIKLMCIYFILILVLVLFGKIIINLWIGKEIKIMFSNLIWMGVMIILLVWHDIFAYFTNGINKTNNQLISTLIGAIINIPLTIFFVKNLNMGLNGVLLATSCSLLIFSITGPIQAYKELLFMNKRLNDGN
jgi:O-antigen/teichoic acid export membrane protein